MVVPSRRHVSSVRIIPDCRLLKNGCRYGTDAVTILIDATNWAQTTAGHTAKVKSSEL